MSKTLVTSFAVIVTNNRGKARECPEPMTLEWNT